MIPSRKTGIAAAVALAMTLVVTLAAQPLRAGQPEYRIIAYDDLLGWKADDQTAALEAFVKSCADISAPVWAPLCRFARTGPDARAFFETFFLPVIRRKARPAAFTGYFEPILEGALQRDERFRYPIYRKPPGLKPADPALTRAAIDGGSLAGKGLEIAWVDDPVELYYLHIQGSGRIRLRDGRMIRVGYSTDNGHPYRSAARELVRRGELDFPNASIEGIKQWFRKNPARGMEALEYNPSYVFFRVLDKEAGSAYGALDRPLTGMRSLAVDPGFVQIGAPVWIEKGGTYILRRLMVAQDTGAAIKGPDRADIFFGSGPSAGRLAGQVMDGGRMVVLLPIAVALRLAGG